MMDWYGGGWSYGWMIVMMLGWVLLLAVGIWAVVALTRRSDRPDPAAPPPTPRQVLDGRLAAGDISAEEYVQARRLLEDGSSRADRAPSG